jgi:hypothetical protein
MHFPKLLRDLPRFDGPFDAFEIEFWFSSV